MAWSKESRQARGYGADWDKLRAQVLARDGHLCQCPDCQGGKVRALPAHEVDHIKPKAWFRSGKAKGNPNDPSNLRAVLVAQFRTRKEWHLSVPSASAPKS